MASGSEAPNTIAAKYESNIFDELQFRRSLHQLRFNGKLRALISGGGAIIMASAFFLAFEGYFEVFDPILLVIFAFGLRFVIIQSRVALRNWSGLLREREILGLLRQILLDQNGVLGTSPLTLTSPIGPVSPLEEPTSDENMV